jgi:hydrogenase nickel incorporation protein HypA/HybF
MHEMGLAQDIIRNALPLAQAKGLEKISQLKVKAGETLLIHPEEFDHAFAHVSQGTIAEGARVELEISPLRAQCQGCGSEFKGKELRLDCPQCGSNNIQIVSGKELEILEIY